MKKDDRQNMCGQGREDGLGSGRVKCPRVCKGLCECVVMDSVEKGRRKGGIGREGKMESRSKVDGRPR